MLESWFTGHQNTGECIQIWLLFEFFGGHYCCFRFRLNFSCLFFNFIFVIFFWIFVWPEKIKYIDMLKIQLSLQISWNWISISLQFHEFFLHSEKKNREIEFQFHEKNVNVRRRWGRGRTRATTWFVCSSHFLNFVFFKARKYCLLFFLIFVTVYINSGKNENICISRRFVSEIYTIYIV